MPLLFHILDVFTDRRFGGNPLAVVLDADRLTTSDMQTVVREFNLSETIFVLRPNDPSSTAKVRIFTLGRELPFAGHPIVGGAVLLASLGREAGQPFATTVTFEAAVGLVPVAVRREGDEPPYGEFTAAVLPEPAGEAPPAAAIAAALGIREADIGFAGHRPTIYKAGNGFVFVPLASREALSGARPEVSAWQGLRAADTIGAYLYCRGGNEADFHARLFAPDVGVLEDPATGSAAATLPGPLMAAMAPADGTHRWTIAQGDDMGRPSRLRLSIDVAQGRLSAVRVGGQAVRVSEGMIIV